jgi:protein-L-isoaspartate(D-aspartate) O-methyltransferase
MPDFLTQRLNMVEAQVRANDVTDPRIQDAMREVAREQFVPSAKRGIAYADAAIEVVRGRYLLEPRTFAKLLQLANVAADDRVLDVACATGYSTAVLARLCKSVIGLEQDADLVRVATETLAGIKNVTVVQGSFIEGAREHAPYDVIFLNGAIEVVSDALLAQLADGGRLVTVVQEGALARAHLFLREHGRVGHRVAFDAAAPLLAGFKETVGFIF